MKIKNDHLYRKMCTFWFNNKHMVMFMDNTSRMSFLEIDENNKFHYPELRDVLALTDILHEKPVGVYSLIYDNNRKEVKKFHFIPKVKMAGVVTLLSASLLMGCGKTEAPTHNALDDPQPGTIAWGMKYGSDYTPSTPTPSASESTETEVITNDEEQTVTVVQGTGASTEHWNEASDPLAQKYLALLSPADDEYDYKWANDYVSSSSIGYVYARDSKAYEEIFGFSKPTEQELYTVLEANNNISPKYKEFIHNFIHDYLTLYPETDFSVLKYNLQTLVVDEMTEKQIQMKAMSIGTVACYLNNENTICIREDNNAMDKSSDDYVVLAHELMHACRICKANVNGRQVSIKFYEDNDMGLYEDEALITYFAYQLQGLGNKPIYYTFQSNIYRQILEGMDYDGADYMNHSVNYFIEKLQEKFDKNAIDIPAYHFVNLVDSHACTHYKDYLEVDYNNFEDLYKTLAENYAATHLSPDMTYSETEVAWGEFWDDIYFHVAELSTPYPDLNQDCFRPYWNQEVQELGISSALQR